MYSKILVPLDLNEDSFADKAVARARDMAEQFGAEIYLLNVVPGYEMPLVASYFPKQAYQTMLKEAKADLQSEADALLKDSGLHYHCLIREGKPAEVILNEATRLGADLLVMASHKHRRLDRVALGRITNKVVARSEMPVLVIKP